MNNLKVDIYASNRICGGESKQLVCSINTESSDKSKIVRVYHNIISRIDFNRLGETQRLVITKLTTLEALGNGWKIKLREFDIECMKRVIDSINEHPDFECFYNDKDSSYDDRFNNGYDDLALVDEENNIVMKITRDHSENVEYIYVSKEVYGEMFTKFMDMILFTGHNNGKIIEIFEQLNLDKDLRNEYEFRKIDWDIIPDGMMKNSPRIVIECSISCKNELKSHLPLFRLRYTKISDYYSLKGFKHTSIIENLHDGKLISSTLMNKINNFTEDGTVESFEDLQDDLIELFGIDTGLIFDIILDKGSVISIDSDDYCVQTNELNDGNDLDDYEVEEKNPVGFALLRDTNRTDSLEDVIAFAFQYTGRLYPRICDNFIADLTRANVTAEFAKELSKLNGEMFASLYDFKACVDKMLDDANERGIINFKSRLEVLMDDNVDIKDFKNMLSITIINKRNNISVGRLRFIKNKINDQVSVSRQVTINGYSSLNDNIRESVKNAISDYPSVVDYDSGHLAGVLNTFVCTDELELIIIKDGKAMYMDKNTRIIYGDNESNWFNIHDTSEPKIHFSQNTPYEMDYGYKGYKNTKNEHAENKITFDDVVGMDQVKEKLYDVIDQFKNRDKYAEWGIKPIRGVLLYGPSGTGKSFISEALANEVDARFVKKSSGDIMSKYIGQSGQNVKKIFDEARQTKGNTIIFIDEIDAIASKRSGEENKERNATLNELLVQMSSNENENIFMIFATNLIDLLDPAFLRSGRCDFKIEVPLPDFEMRKGILEKASGKRPLSDELDFNVISRNMSGMNCADVAHVSNEAARRALKAKKDRVESSDYEAAIEDMICGSNIKTTKLSDKEKTTTAYHEIGHFFMNHILDLRKAKKISILPRGSALGFVLYANEKENDKFLYTKDELMNQIKTLLAGRAMEEIFLDDVSTGASDDLKKANKIARDIICKYGFNDSLLVLDENDVMSRNKINSQVKELLDECYTEVKETLKSERHVVESLSKYLYDKEDVTGDDLVEYIESIKAGNEN